MTKSKKSLLLTFGLILVIIVCLAFLRQYLQQKEDQAESKGGVAYAEMVRDNDPLLVEFRQRHPERTVLLACSEDITNDGKRDLVVISQLDDANTTIALIDDGNGGFIETEPVPAPKENQHIRFMNIDKLGAIETLITGEKNGQVGYAVYRIMDDRMVDLYRDGMEECC
ncbi:MAG: hypothetical protein KBS83_07270 [Lachnospiraceae bacterium]|nr:hypothetical protein [Candidatus Equihabitans merdae]